jgi:hypothetical protein
MVQSQPGQIVCETLSQEKKKTTTKTHHHHNHHQKEKTLLEWLKV